LFTQFFATRTIVGLQTGERERRLVVSGDSALRRVNPVMLADEFFLIAHDEHNGKLRLHRRAAGLGLAGALLAELLLTGHVHAGSGILVVIDQTPPEDFLSSQVLRQLASEPRHQSIRTWLAFLGQGAVDRVGIRLVRNQHAEARRTRRPWGTTVRYIPIDSQLAAWPAARLNLRVNRAEPLSVTDATLAGLVAAAGLAKHVWWDATAVTNHNLAAAVASLPMALREIVAQTEAAVGDSVLAPNT
jgi:Golgi phosphoprotein 3 (GPP34)